MARRERRALTHPSSGQNPPLHPPVAPWVTLAALCVPPFTLPPQTGEWAIGALMNAPGQPSVGPDGVRGAGVGTLTEKNLGWQTTAETGGFARVMTEGPAQWPTSLTLVGQSAGGLGHDCRGTAAFRLELRDSVYPII